MISESIKELRERWQSPAGRTLALEVTRWLAGKGRRPPRGVDEHDGRLDLRGFPFPDARQIGSFRAGQSTFQAIDGFPQFESVHWRGIDFTGAVLRNARFFTTTITDCRFDQADLHDWRLWNSQITDCSFTAAEMQNSAIGTGNHRDGGQHGVNVWTRVSFDRAKLSDSTISECVFRTCTFRKAKLRNVWFSYVTFDGVVFEGLLDGVKFRARQLQGTWDPGPMRNVDFRGVMFRGCDFQGYEFEGVFFDDSSDIRVIRNYLTVARRALDLARDSSDPMDQLLFPALEEIVQDKATRSYDSVFFSADFTTSGLEEAGAALERLLVHAEADLALRGS